LTKEVSVPAKEVFIQREDFAVVSPLTNLKALKYIENSTQMVWVWMGDEEIVKPRTAVPEKKLSHPVAGNQVSGIDQKALSPRRLKVNGLPLSGREEVNTQRARRKLPAPENYEEENQNRANHTP
jgi:hypothetical protein